MRRLHGKVGVSVRVRVSVRIMCGHILYRGEAEREGACQGEGLGSG